ncbi:MAG: phosphotransferase, partial [Candidatus Binatia bacterium]
MSDLAGINHPNVAQFFAERVPHGDVPLAFSLISGGRSNITYLVEGGGRSWVLRRPPLGHVLPTAHDMAREYRVQAALADTDVPVARPIALCEDVA